MNGHRETDRGLRAPEAQGPQPLGCHTLCTLGAARWCRRLGKFLLLALIAISLTVAGCDFPLEGLRWAPSEQIRQNAQVAADLAGPLAVTGSPPGSSAARKLAAAARTQTTYTGAPTEPIDITALLDQRTTGLWGTRQRQVETLALKDRLADRTEGVLAERLTDLAESVQGKAKVDAGEIVHRVQALVDAAHMGRAIRAEIRVPRDPEIGPAAAAALAEMEALVDRTRKAADAQAARRPTAGEVVEKTLDAADSTLDRVGGILETYWPAALALPGVGGLVYGARKRRQERDAKQAVVAAKEEAAAGQKAAQTAVAAVVDVVRNGAAAKPPAPAVPAAALDSPA